MNHKNIIQLNVLLMLLVINKVVYAERLHASQPRIDVKNEFVAKLVTLQLHEITNQPVVKQSRTGGYANYPDFYLEDTYLYKGTDRVLSVVQHEKLSPENLHSIEVYRYDQQGRVIRDYSASFLPNARKAPVQTLISLHVYNGDYHAFRTFDAFGTRIYERCEQGDTVVMHFDEEAIENMMDGSSSVAKTDLYQACFKNLALTAGAYLTPQ